MENAKEGGAGKIIALVFAFLLMPMPVGFFAVAGYWGGRIDLWMLFVAPMIATLMAGGGLLTGGLSVVAARFARASQRVTVRRLALVTLVLAVGGSLGSCMGGCVWGYKNSKHEWPEPAELKSRTEGP